jgi:hypothetical protein
MKYFLIAVIALMTTTQLFANTICGMIGEVSTIKNKEILKGKRTNITYAKLKTSEIPLEDLTDSELILILAAKTSNSSICITLNGAQKDPKERVIELK